MASPLTPAATFLATLGVRSRARASSDTVTFERPSGPPPMRTALGELGAALDAARLVGALPRLASAPRGDGHLVVDIPGWKAPELSGLPLRTYLRRQGYDARGWGFGTNTGNPRRDVERLAARVLELVEQKGSPASLVGWSLGGVIAREVARLHPEAVRRVITYGTPVGGPSYTTIARAYDRGPGAGGHRVARRRDETDPIAVPLTVLFSRRDGIVSWQACIDHSTPDAEHIEISSTHLGMGFDPDVWAIVAARLPHHHLADPPQGWARRDTGAPQQFNPMTGHDATPPEAPA
ncbi:alpha/beta fold hydrolase [Nocardioides sp.]|uniref:alpha/beta fold hydrolase n=1 Tax=Nocardioides sp. TaxID=35761 RepID=UPI00260EF35A|nr:alpha/beta fold hydrolase [Nocardioides sp.]MCW2737906.1 Alpha/beta hydrolase family protein [Nocardioides sp.]